MNCRAALRYKLGGAGCILLMMTSITLCSWHRELNVENATKFSVIAAATVFTRLVVGIFGAALFCHGCAMGAEVPSASINMPPVNLMNVRIVRIMPQYEVRSGSATV